MDMQPSLNPEMRAILVDWLVEVQVGGPPPPSDQAWSQND